MPESLISTKLGVGNLSGFLVPLLATCSVHGNSGPCRSQYVDVTRCSHFQQSKEGGSSNHKIGNNMYLYDECEQKH